MICHHDLSSVISHDCPYILALKRAWWHSDGREVAKDEEGWHALVALGTNVKYAHIHSHMHIPTRLHPTHKYAYTHTHALSLSLSLTHTHAHTQTDRHTRTYTNTKTHTHTHSKTRTHTHNGARTHTQSHVHYIHNQSCYPRSKLQPAAEDVANVPTSESSSSSSPPTPPLLQIGFESRQKFGQYNCCSKDLFIAS